MKTFRMLPFMAILLVSSSVSHTEQKKYERFYDEDSLLWSKKASATRAALVSGIATYVFGSMQLTNNQALDFVAGAAFGAACNFMIGELAGEPRNMSVQIVANGVGAVSGAILNHKLAK